MAGSAVAPATAFGLDIACETPLAFLHGAIARPTGRALRMSVHADQDARSAWPEDAELICDEKLADGGVNFRIETHPAAGYLIWGPQYGAHLLSLDGGRLRCFPEGQPDSAWQRLLIAQVLPFAALLQGLEVFHASAVSMHGGVLAFLGPSGSGKTSIALELCRRGADFMADDVLALERSDDTLLAHPGSPVAGVNRSSPASPGQEHTGREPVLATNARESIVEVRGAREPARLTSLFFLERRADGPDHPRFESVTDALSLLSATFNFVLATPERLRGLLDVCALAALLRVELIVSGPATDTPALADALEHRLSVR